MSIKVENITHIYSKGLPNESVALRDVSFDINDGEFVGLIGHTGSGKSTLLQHLNGLLKPQEGKIYIDEKEITAPKAKLIDIRRSTGLVFQYPEYQLFEETVLKDVAFGPKNLGLDEEETKTRCEKALRLVGIDPDEVGEKSPFEFSEGQKRRIAIAGVIATEPKTLILDEPTAGLDPETHKNILDMILDIHEKTGNTIILATHNMEDIVRLADRILVMEDGALAMMGKPLKVFSNRDELAKLGLAMPETCKLADTLRDKGFKLPEGIFTREVLAEEILKAINQGGEG